MKNRIPTVSIAVCAFNEEDNIKAFLESILMQDTQGYLLTQILVISDGSTDRTVAIAKSIQQLHPIIKIISYKKRIGKSSHLNNIYRTLRSDYLIQTDADVVFGDNKVIVNMLYPLQKKNNLAMTCGNPKPLPAKNYLEKGHNIVYLSLCNTHKNLRNGQNAFIADGRILAYKKNFIKTVRVPTDMIANDVFTYYACRNRNLCATYVPTAVVYYRGPQTLKDKIRQNARSCAIPERMSNYFPKDLIKKEMYIPFPVSLWSKWSQFTKAPIMSTFMYIINKYCLWKAKEYNGTLTAVWPIAETTKKLFLTSVLFLNFSECI